MANTPKSIEEKLNRILKAWKDLAPNETFGGMTVVQFEALIAPSMTSRANLLENDNRRTQLMNERDNNDEVSLGKSELVTNGVIGNPAFGPNSSLIEAMGYTRKSERGSGLTRKAGGGTPPPPPKT
jgi:hypothetical protein